MWKHNSVLSEYSHAHTLCSGTQKSSTLYMNDHEVCRGYVSSGKIVMQSRLSGHLNVFGNNICKRKIMCWCVVVFNVPPTAKVIWRRGHSLKSHPTDWWSRESNLRPLVYRASGLSTAPQRLLKRKIRLICYCFPTYYTYLKYSKGVTSTHLSLMEFPALINWTNPFRI